MAKFTKAQQKAIEYETNNILINAGAGSGKTTVLTQRIINKLLKGTKINQLLVLTFTNAAAAEMKERIINEVKKHKELESTLPYVYISDIMTFDSFLLKLLKKYGYIIDVNKNIKVGDDILLDKMLSEIINDIFNDYYNFVGKHIKGLNEYKEFKNLKEVKNESLNKAFVFFKFIDEYTIFSDENLKDNIKSLYLQYINVLDKNKLYENITSKSIEDKFFEYESLLLSYPREIQSLVKKLNNYCYDQDCKDVLDSYEEKLRPLISVGSYNALVEVLEDFNLPSITRKKDEKYDKLKEIHEDIKKVYADLKKNILKNTKKDLIREEKEKEELKDFILNMLEDIDEKYLRRKKENNIFNFADIMKLVIKILKENEEIRNEIKDTYKEILVDEYQDTNDFQNEFINLIQNDNLYLVGDVKQSIYRFRNANPQNFQELQNTYEIDSSKGSVINLLHNFRSREEVLTNVNNIFENIMTPKMGMIDYKNNQALEYGNKSYDIKDNIDYNMDCLIYDNKEYGNFESIHIEPYIIAQDIRQKIDSGYKVLKNGELKECKPSDFVILTRSKKGYDEYKKVFDYFKLPLIIQKEEILNDKENYEIITLLNILKLVVNPSDKVSKVGLLRSFIYEALEQDIYDYLKHDKPIKEVKDIESKIEKIKKENIRNLELLLAYIYKEFDFYKHAVKMDKISTFNSKIIKINEVAHELTDSQNNIYDLVEYLNYCFSDNKLNVELDEEKNSENSINIMTIHKSKGLEFPIVYIAKLNAKLINSSQELIKLKNDNIILPKIENYIKYKSFMEYVENSQNQMEEVNESIRLLYVAMTRAKEKIIFIDSSDISKASVNNPLTFSKIRDFIYDLKYHMNKINIIKNEEDDKIYEKMKESFIYNNAQLKKKVKSNKAVADIDLKIDEVNIKNKFIYNKLNNNLEFINLGVSSKEIENVLTTEEKNNVDMGIEIHKCLERLDFSKIRNHQYITKFLKTVQLKYVSNLEYIIDNIKQYNIIDEIVKFYTEYEFYYEKEGKQINGIIDLLIETKDGIYIIDYKLKDIYKDEYITQVNTYKEVIEKYYSKDVYGYLYSLLDNRVLKVD